MGKYNNEHLVILTLQLNLLCLLKQYVYTTNVFYRQFHKLKNTLTRLKKLLISAADR